MRSDRARAGTPGSTAAPRRTSGNGWREQPGAEEKVLRLRDDDLAVARFAVVGSIVGRAVGMNSDAALAVRKSVQRGDGVHFVVDMRVGVACPQRGDRGHCCGVGGALNGVLLGQPDRRVECERPNPIITGRESAKVTPITPRSHVHRGRSPLAGAILKVSWFEIFASGRCVCSRIDSGLVQV